MPDTGVDDDEPEVRRKRHVTVFLGRAVEQKGVATTRKHDAGWIHQPDRDTRGQGELRLL